MNLETEVWMGVAGGCAPEVLHWFRIRKDLHKGVPHWAKSWLYWMVTIVMVVFGGLLVFMYDSAGDVDLNLILAFNIGASAPLIIESLTGQVPRFDGGSVN